jgi:HSP20 family molecular chaperone IbpA
MALIIRRDDPLFGHWFNNILPNPVTLFGQDFGNELAHDVDEMEKEMRQNGTSKVQCDKDKYQVTLDVQHFKPEEVKVTTTDNCITVEGKHEEKADEHGYVMREFRRRYILPEDVKPETVHCKLSADGVLTLQAPRALALEDKSADKPIPVVQTGVPHYSHRHRRARQQNKKQQCCRQVKDEKCCQNDTAGQNGAA